jgi:hypothetical protein
MLARRAGARYLFLMRYGFAGSSHSRYGVKRPVFSALASRGRRFPVLQSFFESVHGVGFLQPGQPAENAPAHGRNRFEVLTKGEIVYEADLEAIDYRWFGSSHVVSLSMRSSEREAPPDHIERFYVWSAWNFERQP